MHFKIYSMEKKINKHYMKAILEFEKRLMPYCKIKMLYAKSSKEIEKELTKSSYVIIINNGGKGISSEELADKIKTYANDGNSNILILIGDKWNEVVHNENIRISMMHFSVSLQMVILYEQLYRAFKIIYGGSYHK